MRRDRLERLETLLRRVHAEGQHRLDMRDWGGDVRCGTIGCAVGATVLDPWFREQGLRLNNYGPRYQAEEEGFAACAEFFDIPYLVATWLFSPSSYTQRTGRRVPLVVANRIRGVLGR